MLCLVVLNLVVVVGLALVGICCGNLLCLWVKIEWVCGGLVVEIMADRWWVSLEAWVILA